MDPEESKRSCTSTFFTLGHPEKQIKNSMQVNLNPALTDIPVLRTIPVTKTSFSQSVPGIVLFPILAITKIRL